MQLTIYLNKRTVQCRTCTQCYTHNTNNIKTDRRNGREDRSLYHVKKKNTITLSNFINFIPTLLEAVGCFVLAIRGTESGGNDSTTHPSVPADRECSAPSDCFETAPES